MASYIVFFIMSLVQQKWSGDQPSLPDDAPKMPLRFTTTLLKTNDITNEKLDRIDLEMTIVGFDRA